MILLDGKKASEDIKNEIAAEVNKMKANGEKVPHLAAVIVGNDGASLTYVGSKVRACERVGFESTLVKMPSTTSETELLKKIKELNTHWTTYNMTTTNYNSMFSSSIYIISF